MNRLNIRTKKELLYANAIIRSERFRESRGESRQGRILYNQELKLIEIKAKQFKVNISPLPEKMRL